MAHDVPEYTARFCSQIMQENKPGYGQICIFDSAEAKTKWLEKQ
jgi:hypothetical protein